MLSVINFCWLGEVRRIPKEIVYTVFDINFYYDMDNKILDCAKSRKLFGLHLVRTRRN